MLLIALAPALLVIAAYGLHRTALLALRHLARRSCHPVGGAAPEDPVVTVQLPMFNEAAVAVRAIEAACRLDWPDHRLQVQVLDDSVGNEAAIARRACERLAAQGRPVEYRHRADRNGFKAGALRDAMPEARGAFVLLLDADFVPPPDLVRRLLDGFTSPDIGMVQTRWDHLNERASLLTRAEAALLDGHFLVEQPARAGTCRWFNFNGTAGMWRRTCIDDAGGWHADTLTEDTDLSYRAQLRGWRFRYLVEPGCPAELPPTVRAFVAQQQRWSKGLVQCALKLLPTILRSDASMRVKAEAWMHLTAPTVQLATLSLVLMAPLVVWRARFGHDGTATTVAAAMLACGSSAAAAFYVVAQRVRGHGLVRSLAMVPVLMALGVGLSVSTGRAVLEALFGVSSPFVRTPKAGDGPTPGAADPLARRRSIVPAGAVECALAALMLACAALAAGVPGGLVGAPFLALFAVGLAWIGLGQLLETPSWPRRRRGARQRPAGQARRRPAPCRRAAE